MGLYTNLPIFQASYSLILAVSRMMPDMPRECRYSLGQEVRQKIMSIILQIYNANRTRDKLPIISAMRESLLEVQVYIRLMCDLHYISERKYIELVEQTTSMSKQMSAWEKSEIKRLGGGQK